MASVEEHIVKITQQVQGGSAANGAMAKLEAQIRAEERALAGLGGKADAARAKLAEMMEGGGKGSVSLAAIDKQRAAVAALEKQMAASKAGIGALGDAKGMAAQIDAQKEAQKAQRQTDADAKAAAGVKAGLDRKAAAEQRKTDSDAKRAVSDKASSDRKAAADQKRVEADAKRAVREQAAEKRRADAEIRRGIAERAAAERKANAEAKLVSKKSAVKDLLGGELGSMATAAETVGGPVGEAAGQLKALAGIAGQAGGPVGLLVVALAALVAVLSAVAIGALAAYIALTKFAIASADAARSQRLFDNAAAGGVARGSELNKVVSQIASEVPIAREEVAAFGRQLELAGISGARMHTALAAISMIESVVPGAGAKIEGLVERFQKLKRAVLTKADLEGTGLALVDVAAQLAKGMNITQAAAVQMLQNGTAGVDKTLEAMRAAIEQKFGKTIAGQMLSISVQLAKFKENIAALFTGLDLEPLLAGLKSITDLFSQNTVTGRVLKATMTLWLQGAIDKLAALAPIARAFFLGLAIGALKLYIALKPVGAAVEKAFAGVDKAQAMNSALMLAQAIVLSLELGIKVVAGALIIVASLMKRFGSSAEEANPKVMSLVSSLAMLSGGALNMNGVGNAAGGGLGDGVVLGIQSKIGDVVAAVSSMGAAAEQALRNALGWHSPATLGVDAAVAVGEGVEVGAGKAEGSAGEAMGNIVNPKGAKDAAKAAKGGGKIIYIEKLVIGSRDDLTAFRASLLGEFEFQGQT